MACTCGKNHSLGQCLIKAVSSNDNTVLDQQESSKEYKDFQATTQKALSDQWEDLVYTGIIIQGIRMFGSIFDDSKATGKAITKKELAKMSDALQEQASRKLTSIGEYDKYKTVTRNYLTQVMNVGGQTEIDKLLKGSD